MHRSGERIKKEKGTAHGTYATTTRKNATPPNATSLSSLTSPFLFSSSFFPHYKNDQK